MPQSTIDWTLTYTTLEDVHTYDLFLKLGCTRLSFPLTHASNKLIVLQPVWRMPSLRVLMEYPVGMSSSILKPITIDIL
jgi:hypothetical protein